MIGEYDSTIIDERQEIDDLLSLDEFKDYLKNKPPFEIIGRTGYCAHCPIAGFISTRTGEVEPYVDLTTFQLASDSPELPLPTWAVQFIEMIDGPSLGRDVTAAEALAVLQEISSP